MTVMAWGNGILSAGIHDLFRFQFTVRTPCIRKSRLQESTTAAATIVVGLVGSHIDEIFFTNDLLNNVAEIIGNGVTEGLSD